MHPLTALRQIDTRIATLTRRESTLTATLAELRDELDAAEDDLETMRAELAAATAERGAAAARGAIPNAKDPSELVQVDNSSIHTLRRVSDISDRPTPRTPSEASTTWPPSTFESSPPKLRPPRTPQSQPPSASSTAPAPCGIHTEYADDQDM